MSTQFTNRQWRLPNNENKDKQSNYSMDFDSASSDYIAINNNTTLNSISDSVSISQWIKFSGTSQQLITSFGNDYGTNVNVGKFYFVFRNTSNTQIQLASNSTINDGNWHHVVAVKTTSNITIYIDGVLDKTDTTGDVGRTSTRSNAIGALYDGSINFDGSIDAVSIFDYALTDGTGGTVNQIAALYGSSSTGIGNPMAISGGGKPVAYYNLGDKSAFNSSSYLIPNSSLKDYVFDFDNDYVTLNSSINLTGNKTVSYWVNPDSLNGNIYIGGISPNYYTYMTSTQLVIKDSTGFTSFTISISTGNWYHICITGDGTNATLYINGDSIGTAADKNPTIDTIGAYSGGGGAINAKMSNVQIFNTALPATGTNSVETLYNNGSPLTSMTGFTSLQGWWKLDASATYDSSTTTWTIPDDSTNSNDGTSSGMTQANLVQSDLSFKTSYSPYALDFDSASSNYIDTGATPSSLNLPATTVTNSNFSISFWYYFNTNQNYDPIIQATQSATNGFGVWQSSTNTASLNFWVGHYSSGSLNTNQLTSGTWYHIACVFEGGATHTQKIYVDGVLNNSVSYTTSRVIHSSKNCLIGGQTFQGRYLDGKLSNISIWDTALTQAQVTEIYNEGVPSNLNNHSAYSNLVSWWQLGSNSSFNTNWTVLDEKGSNNGTSVNMGEDAIVDGVGSYANGLSSGMGGDEVIGDAPYSTANALSVNMDVEDRVTDTPS